MPERNDRTEGETLKPPGLEPPTGSRVGTLSETGWGTPNFQQLQANRGELDARR